jgi:hypothetical protein
MIEQFRILRVADRKSLPVIETNKRRVIIRLSVANGVSPLVRLEPLLVCHPNLFLNHTTVILSLLYLCLDLLNFRCHNLQVPLDTFAQVLFSAKFLFPYINPVLNLLVHFWLFVQLFLRLLCFDRPNLYFFFILSLQINELHFSVLQLPTDLCLESARSI